MVEQSRASVVTSVAQADKAGAALAVIAAAVNSISDMSTQIASAAEQQSTVAEEINRNIHGISAATRGSASGIEQISGASAELAQLATQLSLSAQRFRVPAA